MICPILSQAARDGEGNVVWDHHDCIETACTFWASEINDCGIRASGLVVIQRARAALAAQGPDGGPVPAGEPLFAQPYAAFDPSVLDPIAAAVEKATNSARETGLKLLEGVSALEEPLRATGLELGSRMESLNASVLSITTSVEGRIARLEEGIAAIRQAQSDLVSARPDAFKEIEEALSSVTRRLGGVTDRFTALSENLETVSSQVGALHATHEDLSSALALEAQRRREEEQQRRKDDAMALNSRGVALYYKGATQAAEAAFRSALEIDPGFAEAHNNLGLALSREGRDVDAEACFRRALELDPKLGEAMNNLGFLFHQNMQFEKAVDMFRRSALEAQDASLAYTNLGNACYKLGKFGDAVDAWKKAVDQNPLNESAQTALRMFQQEHAS